MALPICFLIQRQKARKDYDLPGRTQTGPASAISQIDGRPFQPRRSHLACERPFEDKVVEFRVIARPCPIAIKIRRTNRLLRFLGVFGLGLKSAERSEGKKGVCPGRFRWSP